MTSKRHSARHLIYLPSHHLNERSIHIGTINIESYIDTQTINLPRQFSQSGEQLHATRAQFSTNVKITKLTQSELLRIYTSSLWPHEFMVLSLILTTRRQRLCHHTASNFSGPGNMFNNTTGKMYIFKPAEKVCIYS